MVIIVGKYLLDRSSHCKGTAVLNFLKQYFCVVVFLENIKRHTTAIYTAAARWAPTVSTKPSLSKDPGRIPECAEVTYIELEKE